MRKKLGIFSALCAVLCGAAFLFSGCAKKINYLDYVSERRTEIYLYEDDGVSIKIYCSEREQPYATDGFKGETCEITEVFVTLPKNPEEVEVNVEGLGGEMSYRAVDGCFFISFSAAAFKKESVNVMLNYDGKESNYKALTVIYAGVLSCDEAVKCVIDSDKELFESLTKNKLFDGEIYVRLLYDEGCYYYVGVCNKQKRISAYLVDGEHGKIIARKTLQG